MIGTKTRQLSYLYKNAQDIRLRAIPAPHHGIKVKNKANNIGESQVTLTIIHTWKPALFSNVAILCTKPKAENTCKCILTLHKYYMQMPHICEILYSTIRVPVQAYSRWQLNLSINLKATWCPS